MSGETDFLNDALGQIGADPIDNIDDGTVNANHCKRFWPPLRRAILRTHFWNFAEDRALLALSATVPAFEFANSFTLPENFLRVKEYNGANLITMPSTMWEYVPKMFKVEGRSILTNDGNVFMVFVKDVPDMTLWDALAYQAAASWLASKLANAIPKDEKKAAALLGMATQVLMPLALAVDGQENPVQPFIVDDLTRLR